MHREGIMRFFKVAGIQVKCAEQQYFLKSISSKLASDLIVLQKSYALTESLVAMVWIAVLGCFHA